MSSWVHAKIGDHRRGGGSVSSRALSLPQQRHLRGGAEVGDEVADFVVFEGFEQAFGHHGDGRFFAGEDLGFGDDAVLTDEAEGELLVVFRSESGVIATRAVVRRCGRAC